jgi:hypothetical protein
MPLDTLIIHDFVEEFVGKTTMGCERNMKKPDQSTSQGSSFL